MTKYFISILLLLTQIVQGQDKKYNCEKRFNFTLKERLTNYPFNIAKNVMLVSFDDTLDYLPIKNDTVCLSKLAEIKTLSNIEIDSLTSLLYNIGVKGNRYSYTPAACYSPRNAILFLNSDGKAFEFIEICFECQRTRESSKKIYNGISCNQKFDILKYFFAQKGIGKGTS